MKNFVLISFIFLTATSYSQPAERIQSRAEYIELYKDEAIREMLVNGIPASITLAQGILESDNGNSALAKYANNHFGIKCHNGWNGPTFYQDDDTADECFRKYYSAYRSYKDHSEFLRTRTRYAFLFNYKASDYKNWAKGLKKAGYATNPKYANLLIKLIEDNNLSQYDKVRKMPSIDKKAKQKEVKTIEKIPEKEPKPLVQFHENKIKFVIAKHGDSYYKIAKENEMGLWQIMKYNEREKDQKPKAGDIVYLQPKKNKSKKDIHSARKGETMWEISQIYGVKLEKLCQYNNKKADYRPFTSEQIYLRKQ
ncbi:MAG: glucosaminidase domain-containing protein [Flavobacteriales bacterium]|nr:glucosaminidase domain-containing protein [Flavobacteriales bacterium]